LPSPAPVQDPARCNWNVLHTGQLALAAGADGNTWSVVAVKVMLAAGLPAQPVSAVTVGW